MPVPIDLEQAIAYILDTITERLTAEMVPDEVKIVIRGDQHDREPQTPNLWVFPGVARNEQNTRSLAETWTMPVIITPVVKSVNSADKGYRQATRLAARARSIILSDRGLGNRDVVQDVYSLQFEPSAPWHSSPSESLYSAAAQVAVKFRVFEPYL